ncbi:hypothetical protein J437_LFUL016897 [Ladona fulva]|uniref:Bursicon n=1 Tax=Ladona fulva TaxID=123851 RepID=A0A8K0KKK5_LADFU|nr:hypothetical protein J437_LFUL016897 [Ladona fulva]
MENRSKQAVIGVENDEGRLDADSSKKPYLLAKRVSSSDLVFVMAVATVVLLLFTGAVPQANALTDQCQVTPVIHVLQYPGCVPKPIPSFACTGRCTSYLQVSGSKIWQMERSCMCCQESGEREASVSLFCPKAKPGERKFRKVTTKAPLECMCRPCTGVEESSVVPQEIAAYADEGTLSSHFRRTQ